MRLLLLFLISSLLTCSHQDIELITKKGEAGLSPVPEPKIAFNPEHYLCYKTEIPLTIDGKMDDPAWAHADWTKDFQDIEGTVKPKPRFRTRVKMLWDETYLYICTEIQEPDVWANLKKRDSIIFYDNDFEVFIDPNGDTQRYFELEINAFSTEWDLFLDKPYRDGCCALFCWDYEGMRSAAQVDGTINRPGDIDRGWTLEIALPWAVMKECADKNAPPENGDQWRINFSRVEWQVEVKDGKYQKVINPLTGKSFPEDNWVWSPQGVVNMHYPEMWGFVQFSDKTAGAGADAFEYQSDEAVKWALRQVYYRERDYFDNNGKFTNDLTELSLGQLNCVGYQFPPTIQHTWSLFEAVFTSLDGTKQWHIAQDGKVWLTKKSESSKITEMEGK